MSAADITLLSRPERDNPQQKAKNAIAQTSHDLRGVVDVNFQTCAICQRRGTMCDVEVQTTELTNPPAAKPPRLQIVSEEEKACDYGSASDKEGLAATGTNNFKPTPAATINETIVNLFLLWNLPPHPSSCCHFHTALHLAQGCLLKTEKWRKCRPKWRPYTGWECAHCHGLNSKLFDFCRSCGRDYTSESSSGSSDSYPRTPSRASSSSRPAFPQPAPSSLSTTGNDGSAKEPLVYSFVD